MFNTGCQEPYGLNGPAPCVNIIRQSGVTAWRRNGGSARRRSGRSGTSGLSV